MSEYDYMVYVYNNDGTSSMKIFDKWVGAVKFLSALKISKVMRVSIKKGPR